MVTRRISVEIKILYDNMSEVDTIWIIQDENSKNLLNERRNNMSEQIVEKKTQPSIMEVMTLYLPAKDPYLTANGMLTSLGLIQMRLIRHSNQERRRLYSKQQLG